MLALLRAVSHFSLARCPALVSSLLCSYCALRGRAHNVACAPYARGQKRCHGQQELAETMLDGHLGRCAGGDGPHHASRAHAGDRRRVSPNPRGPRPAAPPPRLWSAPPGPQCRACAGAPSVSRWRGAGATAPPRRPAVPPPDAAHSLPPAPAHRAAAACRPAAEAPPRGAPAPPARCPAHLAAAAACRAGRRASQANRVAAVWRVWCVLTPTTSSTRQSVLPGYVRVPRPSIC